MRRRCVFALACLLAGCTDHDWAGIVDISPAGSADRDASSFPATAVLPAGLGERTAHKCQVVAKAREGDASVQGFDDGVQRSVYDKVFAECVHWAVRTQ